MWHVQCLVHNWVMGVVHWFAYNFGCITNMTFVGMNWSWLNISMLCCIWNSKEIFTLGEVDFWVASASAYSLWRIVTMGIKIKSVYSLGAHVLLCYFILLMVIINRDFPQQWSFTCFLSHSTSQLHTWLISPAIFPGKRTAPDCLSRWSLGK